MRVLVTGHQGYLGTVMVPELQAAGHEVTGLDSGYFAECVLGEAPPAPPTLSVDLRDVTAEQLAGFDAVVHLAALSNDPRGHWPRRSPTTSTITRRCGWPGWPNRPGCADSSTPPRVRCTARPGTGW